MLYQYGSLSLVFSVNKFFSCICYAHVYAKYFSFVTTFLPNKLISVFVCLCVFSHKLSDIFGNIMEDSMMYGNHSSLGNHSMGILAPSVPFSYDVTDTYAPVSHDRSQDICDILQQIISISSQSLDEAQMRSVYLTLVISCFGSVAHWFGWWSLAAGLTLPCV